MLLYPYIHLIYIYRCMCRYIHTYLHTPYSLPHPSSQSPPHPHSLPYPNSLPHPTHLYIPHRSFPYSSHSPPYTPIPLYTPSTHLHTCQTNHTDTVTHGCLDITVCTDKHMHMFACIPAHKEGELTIPSPSPQLNMEMSAYLGGYLHHHNRGHTPKTPPGI